MSKKKLFSILTVTLIVFLNTNTVTAQNSYIKDRWNIKLSGSPESRSRNYYPLFAIAEVNYGFGNYLEVGFSVGIQRNYAINQHLTDEGYISTVMYPFIAPTYALNANLHLLPLFVKEENFRFDLYASGKIGGNYNGRESTLLNMTDDYKFFKTQWNCFIGAGAAFYLSKHFGIYTEYGFHKDLRYKMGNRKKLNLGISLKF